VEDPAVFQRKDSLHRYSGEWILTILSRNELPDKWQSGENLASTGLLVQLAELGKRPIAKDRLAVDVALVNRSEIAAVVRQVAMIA